MSCRGKICRFGFASVLALAGGASCSLVFVTRVPEDAAKTPVLSNIECTSSAVAPIVDASIAAYQVVRTGFAVAADDAVYEEAAISREADIGLGLGLTTLFTVSAIYGIRQTAQCRQTKKLHEEKQQRFERELQESKPPAGSALLPLGPPLPFGTDSQFPNAVEGPLFFQEPRFQELRLQELRLQDPLLQL